jgi:hypothetical protein
VARRLSREVALQLLPLDATEAGATTASVLVSASTMPWPELAALYPSLLAASQRKQQGTWFTSASLATPTVARTLAPLLAQPGTAPLRIVDPAVGGGTFLIAALKELLAAGMPAHDALRCLHGVDLDSTAAALAVLAVWSTAQLQVDALLELAGNVRHADGLLDLPAQTFDAVITNPPWETLQSTVDAAARAVQLRRHFHHQGKGKLYTYRLFTERAHQLLHNGGRFGLIVPASLWFDREALPLRNLLLDECSWEWLFGFENREKLFAIDSRYRFAAIVGAKGGSTAEVRTSFGHTSIVEWAHATPRHTLYGRDLIAQLSPHAQTFVEVEDPRDLELVLRMQSHSTPLAGAQGTFSWRQGDFNMTGDRDRFLLRTAAEQDGYRLCPDGRWRRHAGDDELLPLYQGAMIYDLHPNTGAHARGTGFATAWETPLSAEDLRPAYLVREALWEDRTSPRPGARIVLRALSNATNERSAVACLLPEVPCGNSLGVLVPRDLTAATPLRTMAAGAAVLGSLAFDWALRLRLTGSNLNGFVLSDCRLATLDDATTTELAQAVLRLCAVLPWHSSLWRLAREEGWASTEPIAETPSQRAALLTRIDVLTGHSFGLEADDVRWIVRGCDAPLPQLGRKQAPLRHAKGFWRTDRAMPPSARRPNRWLAGACK